MIRNYTWYNKTLDFSKPEAVHQVLAFGTIEEIRELIERLGKAKIKSIFLNYPSKVYRRTSLNFIKNYILDIQGPINEEKYLKDTLRSSR